MAAGEDNKGGGGGGGVELLLACVYFSFRSVTTTTKITNGHRRPKSPHRLRIPIKQKHIDTNIITNKEFSWTF
jgi:hypothetical protein